VPSDDTDSLAAADLEIELVERTHPGLSRSNARLPVDERTHEISEPVPPCPEHGVILDRSGYLNRESHQMKSATTARPRWNARMPPRKKRTVTASPRSTSSSGGSLFRRMRC